MKNQELLSRIRKRENPFSQISNELIDDDSLSIQARFIYIVMSRSITNNEWTFYKSNIQKKLKIKDEKTFNKYWSELKNSGYMKQYKFKTENGQWAYEYELSDTKEKIEKEKIEKEKIEKEKIEKEKSANTLGCAIPTETGKGRFGKKEKEKKNKKTIDMTSLEGRKTTTPKFHPVEKPPCGKTTLYNNTNINNTNINNTNNISLGDIERKLEMVKSLGLKPTKAQNDLIKGFNVIQLEKAISLYKEFGGKSFTYLKNCYYNPVEQVSKKKNDLKFNNFTSREYDYEKLERKLLGWED